MKFHNCGFTGNPEEAFRLIDADNDGKVSYSEFCNIFYENPRLCLKGTTIQTEQFNDSKAYRKIPQEALDREGSRVMDKLSETLRGIAVTDKLLHRPVYTTLREAFKKMDQNGDGWLSYDEFRSAVREMDVSMNEEELKLACVYLDENRDGAIHWSEFVSKLVKGGMSLYDPFKAGRHRTIAALRE